MDERPIVMVSNRGPVSFREDDGRLVARRGAGGLVSGIGPLMAGTDHLWVAAAMTDADRRAAAGGVVEAEGFRFSALDVDPHAYRAFYDAVANATLWFVHHGLFDTARRPVFDRHWHEAWAQYRSVNDQFAHSVADLAPQDAVVLVQDLHLALVPRPLTERRPDLRVVHFSHTPFAVPSELAVLPDAARIEMLEGMDAAHACGFHTDRWARAFDACRAADGLEAARPGFVSPLAPDPHDITTVAGSDRCDAELRHLGDQIGDRALITRVDRIELSKNILRGFRAYEDLLDRRPDLHDRVVLGAFVYPSREGLPEYLAYRQEVEQAAAAINRRFATDGWTPVLYDPSDDFPRSVAALRRADVLLVNPVRDGLNLVAKEGPLVNERDVRLVLSPEAGVWPELGDLAIPAHPFDITATADALAEALDMDAAESERRFTRLRERAAARTPSDWMADLLAAAA